MSLELFWRILPNAESLTSSLFSLPLSPVFPKAVRLESAYAQPQCTRYMVVVSSNGRQDTEESVVLGMDFGSADRFVVTTTACCVCVLQRPTSLEVCVCNIFNSCLFSCSSCTMGLVLPLWSDTLIHLDGDG